MSTGTTAEEVIAVLLRRAEMITGLLEAPTEKRDLVDALDSSRSTVDRGIQELEELDLIEPRPDGVAPTLTAHLLVTIYNAFEERIATAAAQTADDEQVWTTAEERREVLRLVAERFELLDSTRTMPRDKRTLGTELDLSRSTVDRAIRDLEVAGLVHRTSDGYTTTTIGQQAAEQYHATVATVTAILAAQDILQVLPAQCAITPALLDGSETERVDETTPYRLSAAVRDRLETADRLRVVLPVLAAPQLLDLCHRRIVQDGTPVELVIDPALFETLTTEFPGPLSEMAATDAFTAFVGDVPPFGLLLADTDTGTTVAVMAHVDQRSVYGALHNDTAAAIRWAEERYDHIQADATERTAELRDTAPADPGRVRLSAATDLERVVREAEGFVQLTAEYFAHRTPAPPATGWRTGFDLIDVHAGYAIDREDERNGTRYNLTDDLVERLGEGTDHAILGPPGSGKSTVCKAVACQWYEQGNGTVFYRESGTGTTFSSPTILSAHLRAAAAEGHALVVVEDAVRAEANAVFRLMTAFRGNQNVTFLLDAREGEWDDPTAFPTDARLDAYRTEAVEKVSMPTLDEPEAERLLRQFEELTGHEFDMTASQLLHGIGPETIDTQGQATDHSDKLLLLLHRLTLSADPLAGDDAKTPTTLVEEVQRTYADLSDAGDLALDVGILVNLLNAAGIGVYPDLVYALADDGFSEVRNALSALEGRLIFERGEGTVTAPYRTVHEEWSGLFLDHLLDAEGDHAASQRFGRCVTVLLTLADDAVRRERISATFADDAPAIDQIAAAPGEWADTIVERVFHHGLERPGLALLFGTADDPSIQLPQACSPELAPRCAVWRGDIYRQSGDLDQAEQEFKAVAGLVDEDDAIAPDTATGLNARNLNGRVWIARRRGDLDTARELCAQALDSFREIGDKEGEADCYNNFGTVAHTRNNLDRADVYYERALNSYREIDAPQEKRADMRYNLGGIAILRGDFNRAETYLERALDGYREIDTRVKTVNTFISLGELAQLRGELDRAEERLKRSLALARDISYRMGEATALLKLSAVYIDCDNLDRAVESVQQSLAICREIENKWGSAEGRWYLGTIARKQGEFETASEHLTEALTLCRQGGYQHEEANTLAEQGELAWAQDERGRASERFEDAVTVYREIGAIRDAIDALVRLAEVDEAAGNIDAAVDHCETATQLVQEADFELAEKHAVLDDRHAQLMTQTEHPD